MKKASVTHEAFESPAPIAPSVLVGIDWADKEHAFAIRTPDGKLHLGSFKHSPAAIREWIEAFGSSHGSPALRPAKRHVEARTLRGPIDPSPSLVFSRNDSSRRVDQQSD